MTPAKPLLKHSLYYDFMIYLDFAATAPIDTRVLDVMVAFERGGRGNPARGLHALATRSDQAVATSREMVARFLDVRADEVVFVKSATEAANLLACGYQDHKTDEVSATTRKNIVLTAFDHHATLLPWTARAEREGWELRIIPTKDDWTLDLEVARQLIDQNTLLVSAPHISNVTGTILPIRALADLAHEVQAFCFVDGAQSVSNLPISCTELGCDAFFFSGHKMYGPMGVGALMIRSAVRLHLRPLLLGGGMFAQHPAAPYEAGTLNVVGIVGLAEACRVLKKYYDPGLIVLLVQELLSRQLEVFVPPVEVRSGIVSFAVPGVHAHDIAQGLAENDIAVRAGYHCAEPVARQCRVDGTVRVSMSHTTASSHIRGFLSALDAVIALWKTS